MKSKMEMTPSISNSHMRIEPERVNAYFVGGGIASLASAVYLITEAKGPGKNIHILNQDKVIGGTLDGSGSA